MCGGVFGRPTTTVEPTTPTDTAAAWLRAGETERAPTPNETPCACVTEEDTEAETGTAGDPSVSGVSAGSGWCVCADEAAEPVRVGELFRDEGLASVDVVVLVPAAVDVVVAATVDGGICAKADSGCKTGERCGERGGEPVCPCEIVALWPPWLVAPWLDRPCNWPCICRARDLGLKPCAMTLCGNCERCANETSCLLPAVCSVTCDRKS